MRCLLHFLEVRIQCEKSFTATIISVTAKIYIYHSIGKDQELGNEKYSRIGQKLEKAKEEGKSLAQNLPTGVGLKNCEINKEINKIFPEKKIQANRNWFVEYEETKGKFTEKVIHLQ